MKRNKYKIAGYPIFTGDEREEGRLYGTADCPICDKFKTDADDHGEGINHALDICAQKIRTHLIMDHGIKEEDAKIIVNDKA